MNNEFVDAECHPAEWARIADAASELGLSDLVEAALRAAYDRADGFPAINPESLLHATKPLAIGADQHSSKK